MTSLDDILKEVEPILSGKDVFQFAHPSSREILAAMQFAEEIISGLKRGNASILRYDVLSEKVIKAVVELGPSKEALYNLVYSTRQMSEDESGYAGGNSLTLLAELGEDLRGKDFSGTKIRGAKLIDRNLEGMILRDAKVNHTLFDYSNLSGVDIRGASTTSASFEPIKNIELIGYDGQNGVIYLVNDLGSLMQWELNRGETKRIRQVVDPETFKWFAMTYNLCLSSRRDRLLACRRGTGRGPLVDVFDLEQGKKVFINNLSTLGTVPAFSISPDGCYVAVAQQPIGNATCLTLLDIYSGKLHLQEFFPKGICINNVSISQNNRYVVCDMISNEWDEVIVKDGGRTTTRAFGGRNRIFEIQNGNQLFPILESKSSSEPYRKSWFSPDAQFCLVHNGAIFSMEKRDIISQITNYDAGFQFFTSDSKYVVHLRGVSGIGLRPFAYEVKTGSEYELMFEPNKYISDVIISKDDSTAAVKYGSKSEEYFKIAFCKLDLDAKRLILYQLLDIKSFNKMIK